MAEEQTFDIRALQPSDADGISALMREDPDSFATTYFKTDAYTAIIEATEHKTIASAAHPDDTEALAGLATASFGELQYEGEVYPFATLHNWLVSKHYRGYGLGWKLVKWTIEQSRERYGDRLILTSGTMESNKASLALAGKWCNAYIRNFAIRIAVTKKSPPKPLTGYTARELTPDEYGEYIERQNAFYADYNFYEPLSLDLLKYMVAHQPGDAPMFRAVGVFSSGGEIVAGTILRNRGSLMYDRINNPPFYLRILNFFTRMLPSNYIMQECTVQGMWYAPDADASQVIPYLWHTVSAMGRRDHATMIMASFDARSPLVGYIPRSRLSDNMELVMPVAVPKPPTGERLSYMSGRR